MFKCTLQTPTTGRDAPSLICCTRVWTTREEYLVVFIVVQNLVEIGAKCSIIGKFLFCKFGLKCLLTPKMGFWGFDPLNMEACQQPPPKRTSLCGNTSCDLPLLRPRPDPSDTAPELSAGIAVGLLLLTYCSVTWIIRVTWRNLGVNCIIKHVCP